MRLFTARRAILAATRLAEIMSFDPSPHRDHRVRRSLASSARASASHSIIVGGLLVLTLALALSGCAIGPNYSPEAAPVPTRYKELKGWKHAAPSDDIARGDWWIVYKDRALDTLLPQVEVSNQ